MSFWCTIPSFSFRGPDVCVFAVEVGVQALDGAKTRRTVMRRFSDFVALAERLRKELGKEPPPLPPKQRLAARDEAFLNERRRALEAWIWALMQDVEAAHSQSLVSFLELQSARRGLRRERAAPEAVAASAAGPTEASSNPPARSAEAQVARTPAAPANLALRDDERAAVRRTVSGAAGMRALARAPTPNMPRVLQDNALPRFDAAFWLLSDAPAAPVTRAALQQRYAASKADLSDALACLRSDAAVKALLSRRVDELELRLKELGNDDTSGHAGPTQAGSPTVVGDGNASGSAAPAAGTVPGLDAGLDHGQLQGMPAVDADQAEQRCVSLAWQLEEVRAAMTASEEARAELSAACASAEQRARALKDEADAATTRAEAAEAMLAQEQSLSREASARHAGERKTMCREIKSLRRDLAAAQASTAETSAAAASAAAGAIATQLARSLREATLVRERMAEASVEHLASVEEQAVDPLELLAVSDSRVALLAAEAQLLGRSNPDDEASSAEAAHDAEVQVRETLCALLSDNASLRKRVNSLLRATLGNAAAVAAGAPPAVVGGRERGKPWWQP